MVLLPFATSATDPADQAATQIGRRNGSAYYISGYAIAKEYHMPRTSRRPYRNSEVEVLTLSLLHFMICHSNKCRRPRTSSCHKEQRGGSAYLKQFHSHWYFHQGCHPHYNDSSHGVVGHEAEHRSQEQQHTHHYNAGDKTCQLSLGACTRRKKHQLTVRVVHLGLVQSKCCIKRPP